MAIPLRGLFRTIFFSPYITTMAAMALLWVWIYEPTYGIFNYALAALHIEGPRWLTDPQWAMPALILMNVWKQSGYVMVIYLAGLTNIDNSLYEAARDRWRKPMAAVLENHITFVVSNNFLPGDHIAVECLQSLRPGGGDDRRRSGQRDQ